ncbi:hypothetical protein H5183_13615 [Pseudoalteromonas sp. SR44-8]|uniref:hypothetical protein n=1 Tax=Pseudoalteromonas sp. SR44-8 TaxID=2760933 RepID=UPI0016003E5F|nr:hypothetical protein [Pseudoalteromonas sp. SR44-8]MBB1302377.1 hypothetical protein [Pseudoalteromonas sp. SR44-8]
MTQTEAKRLKRLIWLTPIIGVVAGFAYLAIKSYFNWSIGFTEVRTLSTIVAGFSFTMLGFLAAIAAFLFSLQKYRFFKRWVADGNSVVFFTLFKVAFICLFITFGFSLFVFTSQGQGLAFKVMMMSVTNNVIQLCIITIIIMDKVFKARDGE